MEILFWLAICFVIAWLVWGLKISKWLSGIKFVQKHRAQSAANGIPAEAYYEMAGSEIEQGKLRKGLWIQAIAESVGNDSKARARYIELRVQSMRKEAAEAIRAASDRLDKKNSESNANPMLPTVIVSCPKCNRKLRVAGARHLDINCPHCFHEFRMRT